MTSLSTQVLSTSSRILWEVLTEAYGLLGFDALGDEVFRSLVPGIRLHRGPGAVLPGRRG